MTLNTNVWLDGPIHGTEAFDLALKAILTSAGKMSRYSTALIEMTALGRIPQWVLDRVGQPIPDGSSLFTEEWARSWAHVSDGIRTSIGQGLPAITDCKYNDDGTPLTFMGLEPQISLSWDTGYSYEDEYGGCSNLHARALVILRQSLPTSVSMCWQNEYTGEVHYNLLPESLAEFVGEEGAAQALLARYERLRP